MHVEECCFALLSELLPHLDHEREGWTLDIGVGTFAFYCELFDQLQFKTAAVEPLQTDELKRICRYRNIKLIEACLSAIDGTVSLYKGAFHGEPALDLSSMEPEWWGSTAAAQQVRSITLAQLIESIQPAGITCMKIDVEGAELCIIEQMLSLQESLLPRVVMFEYGGGGIKEAAVGGWSEEFLGRTMRCLRILKDLGYDQTIAIDSAPDVQERIFYLKSAEMDPAAIFLSKNIYGNLISLRNHSYQEDRIFAVCRPFRDNDCRPPRVRIREPFLKRARRKFRALFQ